MSKKPNRPLNALFVLPDIPDDADVATKNALAVRNAASTSGCCPDCGATPTFYVDASHPQVMHAVFEHEETCVVVADLPEPGEAS